MCVFHLFTFTHVTNIYHQTTTYLETPQGQGYKSKRTGSTPAPVQFLLQCDRTAAHKVNRASEGRASVRKGKAGEGRTAEIQNHTHKLPVWGCPRRRGPSGKTGRTTAEGKGTRCPEQEGTRQGRTSKENAEEEVRRGPKVKTPAFIQTETDHH